MRQRIKQTTITTLMDLTDDKLISKVVSAMKKKNLRITFSWVLLSSSLYRQGPYDSINIE